MLVIGSKTSSNSNRLKELAEKMVQIILIDDKTDIEIDELKSAASVGITAGASALI